MRIHRFYVADIVWNRNVARVNDAALWNQIRNVFRYTVGTQVILFDGTGTDYYAMIADMSRGELAFSLIESREGMCEPQKLVELAFSLTKRPAFEEVLQHATELGVSIFTPIVTDRSQVKSVNRERAEKIIVEAAEQSGRSIVPVLGNVTTLEEVCIRERVFAFDPSGDPWGSAHASGSSRTTLVIGPEGGWTERELAFLRQGSGVYSLSPTVLRAETAALAAVSVVLIG
jgi:16S rRNA (uracil1498-N3)-methyltransferase